MTHPDGRLTESTSKVKKLTPCPWCGECPEIEMDESFFAKERGGGYSVCCDCGAIGPGSMQMEGAVLSWNERR